MPPLSMRRQIGRALAAVAVALTAAAVLAGCDARAVSVPGITDPAAIQPRSTLSSSASIGSTFLAAPPYSYNDNSPPVQFAVVPESTWVLVEVNGAIQTSHNVLCDYQPPSWPCPTSPVAMAFEGVPAQQGVGPVWICTNAGLTCGGIRLRGSGGAGTSAGSAIGLHYQRTAGNLYGKLNLMPVVAWDPLSGSGPPSWKLSGGYTVSATAIPNPLKVTEGAAEANGTRTYSVQPLYGLQLINPTGYSHLPAGMAGWYFFPGESVSSEPSFAGPYEYIAECEFSTTCRYRPPGPGKVQAAAYVEGQYAFARAGAGGGEPCTINGSTASPNVRLNAIPAGDCQQQPKLKLECSPPDTITRGGEIFCEAVPDGGAGEVETTAWRFTTDDGVTITRPADEVGEATWSGAMVVGGTFTVEGKLDGRQSPPASHKVFVRARVWTDSIDYPAAPQPRFVGTPDLPYPPIVKLGDRIGDGDFGQYLPATMRWEKGRITGGPNDGFVYIAAPPTFAGNLAIHVNRALQPDDPFYRAQRGMRPGRRYEFVPCDQSFMQSAAQQVLSHEARHHEIEETHWQSAETASTLERALGYDPSRQAVVDSLLLDPAIAERNRLQKVFDDGNKLQIRCELHPIEERG